MLLDGRFPKYLKISKIVPLHKSDNQHELENKRMTLKRDFQIWREAIFFLSKEQQHISINDRISYIYGKSFGQQRREAFDTVNKEILIEKLQEMGIRGVACNLVESYPRSRINL